MNRLIHFSKLYLHKLIKPDSGESVIGETVQYLSGSCNIYDDLLDMDVDYVIFGIHENIGAFANRYLTDGKSLFKSIIKMLMNLHSDHESDLKKFAVLGFLDFSKEIEIISQLDHRKFSDIKKARKLVSDIDGYVTKYIHDIVKSGKIPIVIGGGQNNAYGCIKGCSLAINQPINAINLDYYTDFGLEEGRHNANGFAYAFAEGFLHKYFIQGLKEINLSDYMFKRIVRLKKRVQYNSLESIKIRQEIGWKKSLKRASNFIGQSSFGIEIDWRVVKRYNSDDSIIGFDYRDVERFVDHFTTNKIPKFIHFAELNGYGLNKAERKNISRHVAQLIFNILSKRR
jgi:formiminoglutamase